MSAAEGGDVRREPDPISRADYQGHEVRIIKLEEFRNHVAEGDPFVSPLVMGVVVGVGVAPSGKRRRRG